MKTNDNYTQMMMLRIRLARLEKQMPTQGEIDAAEAAIDGWQEVRDNIESLNDALHEDKPDLSDCRSMALQVGDIRDAAHALASAIEESPEAVSLVIAQAELEDAESEYYRALMEGKKGN